MTALFGAAILLSAFLLFQIQPMIAKAILPWFGGTAAVWTTCLLFFQVVLLGGYGYVDWLSRKPLKRQAQIHVALLALSLVTMHLLPRKPAQSGDPVFGILGLLAWHVGLPYFLLSSTSPLLQSWYVRRTGAGVPWRFFALSNAGSLVGLLAYPLLVERFAPLRLQGLGWTIGYAIAAMVIAGIGLRLKNENTPEKKPAVRKPAIRWMWVALAACGSALLLAGTNELTENIAAVPLLWVLPLSLYLISFILCFESSRWYLQKLWVPVGMGSALVLGLNNGLLGIALFCGALFVLMMVCHGELARLRPGAEGLTAFYLAVATGGAAGGVFVAVIAPNLFSSQIDLKVVLAAISLLAIRVIHGKFRPAAGIFAAVLVILLVRDTLNTAGTTRLLARNFYGALSVIDMDRKPYQGMVRKLGHGIIEHGRQWLPPLNERHPTAYYALRSGVGRAITTLMDEGPVKAGLIGLGAGTLSAYARPGDQYRFYEINPLVTKIARSEFTFLSLCGDSCEVVEGDARLTLEAEAPQNYDILTVDAFSGDAIPVHLLTREAFALYFRHMKPDGVLAVHVSNIHVALEPVVLLAAQEAGRRAIEMQYGGNAAGDESESEWVLVTNRPGFFEKDRIKRISKPIPPLPGLRAWTDDYSDLVSVLR